MSVRIFHTSVAPFVQQAARALQEAGQLDRLVVALRDDRRSPAQQIVRAIGRIAGRDMSKEFLRRAVTEVPLDKVETHPFWEWLRLGSREVDRGGRVTDLVWEKGELAFDRKVARGLQRGLTGVYGYEHSSLATFERARGLGIRTAYEMPSPEIRFVQRIMDAEMGRFPELQTDYHRHTARREGRRTQRRLAEWHLADMVVVSSTYTKRSFQASGLDPAKVRVIPCGAPPPAPRDKALKKSPGGPLQLVCAGTFSARKGAHYLLDAWRSGGFGRHARLRVFGSVALPERVLRPLPDGVELGGPIPRPELLQHFLASDALIFPTLCDGFGMVATEAWSQGLPVITTDSAGAADLVRPGLNGLVIPAGSSSAIAKAIQWCLDHRQELLDMREAALETAASWQWGDYRARFAEVLRAEGLFGPSV